MKRRIANANIEEKVRVLNPGLCLLADSLLDSYAIGYLENKHFRWFIVESIDGFAYINSWLYHKSGAFANACKRMQTMQDERVYMAEYREAWIDHMIEQLAGQK